jgi:hypothetical protein
MTQAANLGSHHSNSPDGGTATNSGKVPPPLQRKQINAPMHAVLPAAKALMRRFGLWDLVIACVGQLYPRGMIFPTANFDAARYVLRSALG